MTKGNRRRVLAALGAVAALLWVAGCGGGSNSGSSTATVEVTPGVTETPDGGHPNTATPGTEPALSSAAAALREGRYAEAADMYLALARGGGDTDLVAAAWLGAGVATGDGGEIEAGNEYLRQAIAVEGASGGVVRRATYLLGRRLNDAGEYGAARAALEEVEDDPGDVLQPYLSAELARALAGMGDLPRADGAWDSALASPFASDPLRAAVYRARAEGALAAEDPDVAIGWLEKLVAVAGTPETRYELATLAASAGDRGLFAAQMRAIIVSEPSSDYAVLAIDDLRLDGEAVDAGQEGYVHYRRRNFARAREVLGDGIQEAGLTASELAYRTYYLAASYEDAGYLAESVPLYDQVPLIDPASAYAHRAKYWGARATENMGELEDASARYLALATDGSDGEFSAESAFRAGYVVLESEDPSRALQIWVATGVEDDGRLLYWVGRAHQMTGDTAGATESFQRAYAADPYGLYGEEAGRLLGLVEPLNVGFQPLGEVRPIDWGEIAGWVAGVGGQVPEAPGTAARGLAEIGLRAEARAVVEAEAKGARGVALVGVLREAHEAGLSEVAARMATVLIAEKTDHAWEAPESLLRLAYPLDYVTRLGEVAKGAEIDPLFLAALVRQESFWDPRAVSIAGAIGLTQVMPATGEGIAAAIGPDPWGPGDLTRPGISLAFGAYYLGAQVQRYGSGYVALAAYNAGPGNASEWKGAGGGGSVADFVEVVDIGETKHYVEQVLNHYAYYRLLYR